MKQIILFVLTIFTFTLSYSQNSVVNSDGYTKYVQISKNGSTNLIVPASGSNTVSGQDKNVNQPAINSAQSFTWTLQFTASGKVFKDVSFANTQVGYIVTELGYVYKTTNGGTNWNQVLGLGFPYYWYGVHALSVDTVVISGFNDQDLITRGALRWTTNGGTSWSGDIVVERPTNGSGWLDRVHFFNQNTGITFNGFSGACYYTTTGGKSTGAWNFVQIDPAMGWFAGNYTTLNNGTLYAAGITLSKSTNYGVGWTVGPPADGTFDGGVDFLQNLQYGWTGGGEISPNVEGWTHQTTDGGTTWGARQMLFPYPVRGLKFYNTNTGFAIGGNVYSEAGFIYSTSNGGTNWNLEVSTAAEMFSQDFKAVSADSMDVWVVGSTGGNTGFIGKVYKARMQNLVGINPVSTQIPSSYKLYQNYPNPFNPSTKIKFDVPDGVKRQTSNVKLAIYDILGNEVRQLVNQNLNPGTYEINFDAGNLATGIYFYKLIAGSYTDVKKLMLIK